ncbi:MAG TPA: alpha/beta hydrolase [Terriglobales bacterium]|nr:alpha/beta hydrolase [Terriglobales bacterium]
MAEILLPSGRLRFERLGAGPPLVLLHGLLGSGAQWRAAAKILSAHLTCWLLELPGISLSDPIPDATLLGLRGWLEQAVAGLGLERFALMGASWGGRLAMAFVLHGPRRAQVEQLVLVAPAHPYWSPSRRQRFLLSPTAARAGAWLGARLPDRLYRALLEPAFGDPRRVRASDIADYRAIFQQPGLGEALVGYGRDWRGDQLRLRAALPPASTKTVLVWGERDRVVPLATAAGLCAAWPQAQLRLLPGLGHIPFAEDPAAFAAAVLPFLCE